MKLSQLSTDRALDALCELTPHISRIASDEAVVSAVGKIVKQENEMNTYGMGLLFVERMGEIVPLLLKTHRSDVYGILSVLNEKPAAEIAAQKLAETVRQAREVFQDEELLSFFRSSARRAQEEPSVASASAPA